MLLTILPSVPVWKEADKLVFDRKFYDGILKYCSLWPGTTRLVMRHGTNKLPEFGLVRIAKDKLPFEIKMVVSCKEISITHVMDTGVMLASGDNKELLHIAKICQQELIPCVYIIECNLVTQLQIVALDTPSILRRIKRTIFLLLNEIRRRKAFHIAHGLQANGIPAYESYQSDKRDDLLYFDSRIHPADIISKNDLSNRIRQLSDQKPLRLAFSGRLMKIKGVDDLVLVAQLLNRAKLDFKLSIYGAGELEGYLRRNIENKKITDKVSLKGAVDFHSHLLPALKNDTDLFICLHKQGDPSCTYIETLSCGVPILGYANQAFSGILKKANIGWSAPINDINQITRTILYLDKNRNEIEEKAIQCVDLARNNTFDLTFTRRIDHLIKAYENGKLIVPKMEP